MQSDELELDYETASNRDLKRYGLSRYSRDPSTRVLMGAYSFNGGSIRQWSAAEGEPTPREVKEALADPHVRKIAWNAAFEIAITLDVMGLETDIRSWRCAMVLAMSLSLPAKLERSGRAIGLPGDKQKMSEGKALVTYFTKPRKRTKTKQYDWNTHLTDPVKWEKFKTYNRQDVIAESEIYNKCLRWDLPEEEWALWHLDQEINRRGIPINVDYVDKALDMIDYWRGVYIRRAEKITGLDNVESGDQLLPWLRDRGYQFTDLKKGHIRRVAEDWREGDDSKLKKMLDIRAEISKSSIKKYQAFYDLTDDDDHYRYSVQYSGAGRTMRWSGRGAQVQNLTRPAAWLEKPKQIEMLVHHIQTIKPPDFGIFYAPVMEAMSTGVRPCIQAPEGKVFGDADLNAIENRVLGWMAWDKRILSVFEKDRDPYLDFAQYMYDQAYDELLAEYKRGEKKKRTISKPPVLGCFTEDTVVLTDHGWKLIVDVKITERVHDGRNWVSHGGVAYRGKKPVLCMSKVYATEDHLFETSEGWDSTCQLASKPNHLRKALDLALGLFKHLLEQSDPLDQFISADVLADLKEIYPGATSSELNQLSAPRALLQIAEAILARELDLSYSIFSPIVTTLQNLGAKTRTIPLTNTMDGAVFVCGSRAPSSGASIWSIDSGRTDHLKSIEETMTGTIEKETFVSPLDQSKTVIKDVFDIVDAGPLGRFVVLTEEGPVVAHNCGYMLSGGTEYEDEQTGEIVGTGLLGYAWNMGVRMTLEESTRSVEIWRKTFKGVVEFWKAIMKAAMRCVRYGEPTQCEVVSFEMDGPFLKMILPSGRAIHYYKPMIRQKRTPWGEMRPTLTYMGENDKGQWVELTTHPGKVTENADQAISRDLLAHGIINAMRAGLDVRFHVHDQIVILSDEDRAEEELKKLIECMTDQPKWARDLPLKANGSISKLFMKD